MARTRLNCWEDRQCGREPGGPHAAELGPCPAATDITSDGVNTGENAGRFCWAVSGTLCSGQVEGAFQEKTEVCQECPFFRRVKYEEGCHFQLLKPGLGSSDIGTLHLLLNDMAMLVGICRDIFAHLAVRPLLARITEHARLITRSASASAYLAAAEEKELVLDACAGRLSRPDRIGRDDDTPVAEAFRTRRLCKRTMSPREEGDPSVVVAIPIGGHDTPLGVLELTKASGEFSLDDEWFLREFALITGLGTENAQLVEDLRELKMFDKAKSRFVSLLVHHISSPLATVACCLQVLLRHGETLSDEEREEMMTCGLERISSVQTLSRRLLDLAAIRSGSSLAGVRPVRPAEPLRQELDDRLTQAREKGVELTVQERGAEWPVLADPDGLRLIFGNLLDNAIKYSTGPVKEVEVELRGERHSVRVRIRDHGIGIPAEDQARIFDEFHRAGNVTQSEAKGSGLGLSVVKELVTRYQGDIELESAVGAGTSFTVEFPTSARPE